MQHTCFPPPLGTLLFQRGNNTAYVKHWCAQSALQATQDPARLLISQDAVTEVWPLVEPLLLQDIERVGRYKGA